MKTCALYQVDKTNCLRCFYAWKRSEFHFFLNMYLDFFKPLLQTTPVSVTVLLAWFVKPLRIFFPRVPYKCNTFQTPLINPRKIVSNTASLPRDAGSVILSEAAVFILSCFCLLKPLFQGGQAFLHLLALLEVCSDSCIGWEAANTWVWPAINVFFPLILSILPFILLSWLAIRLKIRHSHISPLDVHLYFCSLRFWCVKGVSVRGLLLAGYPLILICEAPHKHHIPLKAHILRNQRWFVLFGPIQP